MKNWSCHIWLAISFHFSCGCFLQKKAFDWSWPLMLDFGPQNLMFFNTAFVATKLKIFFAFFFGQLLFLFWDTDQHDRTLDSSLIRLAWESLLHISMAPAIFLQFPTSVHLPQTLTSLKKLNLKECLRQKNSRKLFASVQMNLPSSYLHCSYFHSANKSFS